MTPRIGVSQCLIGDPVRHDGGHKLFRFVTDDLGAWAELIPVCPEAEIGLGVPRAAIRLVAGKDGEVLLKSVSGESDHTDAMSRWAAERVRGLKALALSGFVLKAGSPSCGLDVDVHGRSTPSQGLFAQALALAMPDLPMLEETGLGNTREQAAFTSQVREYARQLSP